MAYSQNSRRRLHPLLAVALRHDPGKSEAPRVVASGAGVVAERILEKAREKGVPIHQDRVLAALLADLELNREIPPDLYEVVARVLAFVYRVEGRMGSGGS